MRARRDAVAALIIVAFLGLGMWFSFVVPPFETPDEPYHFGYARHVAQGNGLPIIDPDVEAVEETPWSHEGGQAPLYYLLAGALTAGIDQRDFETVATRNPRANIGDPLFPGNKNFMLYSAVEWPLRGTNLALHVGRWLSLALAAGTLVLIYRLAGMAFPGSATLPLLSLALVAGLPQFVFISASFSNDNAVVFFSTATVWWLARMASQPENFWTRKNAELVLSPGEGERGFFDFLICGFPRTSASSLFFLGVLLGLAALSKLQGLGLLPLAGLTLLWLAWRARSWALLGRAVVWVGVPVLVIAGWWYVRNFVLYGDPLGATDLLAINGLREEPFTWAEARGLRYSFWGLFGWFNLLLPRAAYWFFDAATLLAVGGWLLAASRQTFAKRTHLGDDVHLRSPAPLLLLLTGWLVILFAMLAYWLSGAVSSQGRLLFPGLSAFSILGALGLSEWTRLLPARWRLPTLATLPVLLVVCALFAVGWLIPRTYATPPPLGNTAAAVPADAAPVNFRYGDVTEAGTITGDMLEAVAIDLPEVGQRFEVGQRVPVTLYLRAPKTVRDDYQLFIQLLDERSVEVANLTTHPGWGTHPTSLWQPDVIYADEYEVLVTGPLDGTPLATPLAATVYVGFIDPATEEIGRLGLPVFDETGQPLEAGFLDERVVITPPGWANGAWSIEGAVGGGADVQFGDSLALRSYSLSDDTLRAGDTVTATLQWEVLAVPPADHTASVKILDAAGAEVAGFDQMPMPAERLPIELWQAGDHPQHDFPLALPQNLAPGEYGLWVSVYERLSETELPRLPVSQAGELAVENEQIRLRSLTVAPR